MPLLSGTRLGAYEIVAPLGAGGMGEVYRARDTRLDRTVAIKVLPAALAADAELRQRFEREARAVSSLQHPHICALFDVGEAEAPDSGKPDGEAAPSLRFLVLEYLDGETVAQRIARTGALSPAVALKIGIEICDALDKAHRSGIVHRDLKPANVMLTKLGAKLLDFGLARPTAPVVASSGLSMLPTTPPSMTARGAILGTFQYMAPEQIEGQDADARTDIFALGALLFEMLTGRAAFEGRTRASLLGAILKDEPPPVSQLQPLAPAALDRVVATCLAKEPDDRYQSARDLLRDLKWVAAGGDAKAASPTIVAPRRRSARHVVSAALALVVIGMIGGALIMRQMRPVTGTDVIQFTVPVPDKHAFGGPPAGGTGQVTQLALSPDGRQLAFVASDNGVYQLWIRPANTLTPRLLAGTEGASFPFWSPDGRNIAFFANNKLKKIASTGGPAIVLCDAPGARGGSWSTANVILFGSTAGGAVLQRVSAAGGVAAAASKVDTAYGDTYHRWPNFLPDGRHFVFTAAIGACCPPPKAAEIRIGSLDSFETKRLFQLDSAVQYASGHLLFVRGDTLMAQPFDAAATKLTGDPFPIAEQVSIEGSRYASFSVSTNGVVAFARGIGPQQPAQLAWRNRKGDVIGTVGDAAFYSALALSPDERHIAVAIPSAIGQVGHRDIWIIDAERGTAARLTFADGANMAPIWSPDGSRVAFQGTMSSALRQKSVAGTTADEPLFDSSDVTITPTDWSRDGRYVLFTRVGVNTATASDVWALPLFGDRKPVAVVATPFTDTNATFSPDVRWIAYQSGETGVPEVYVQPFPPTGGRYQVSKGGGTQPSWRSDGKELYFIAGDGQLMAVNVDGTRQSFDIGVPQKLFAAMTNITAGRGYAASRDGQKFLVRTVVQQAAPETITLIVNWLSAVQR